MLLGMPIGGRLYNRTGPKWLIGVGFLMTCFSFYQFSRLSLAVGYWDIFAPQVLQGIGFGFIFVSLSTATLSTIEKPLLIAASGLYSVIRQVFGSIGIAAAATLLTRGENLNRAVLVKNITVYRNVTNELLRNLSSYFYSLGLDQPGAENRAGKVVEGIVMRQSSMLAFNHVYFLVAVLFLISFPLIFLIKDDRLAKFKEKV